LAWLQVSYAIGLAEPLSITVFDYGTSERTADELLSIVKQNFDLRPGRIVKYALRHYSRRHFSLLFFPRARRDLNLRNPIYQQTSTYGHFGRDIFPWEKPLKLVL